MTRLALTLALLIAATPAGAKCNQQGCTLEAPLDLSEIASSEPWNHCRAWDSLGYDGEGRHICVSMPSSDPDVLMIWRTMGGMDAIRTTAFACKAAQEIAQDGLWCLPEGAQ